MNNRFEFRCVAAVACVAMGICRPVVAADDAVAPASTPAVTEPLSYGALMRMAYGARIERLFAATQAQAEREDFLNALPGDRRAALLVDPEDCGPPARLKRLGLAASDYSESTVLGDTARDVGQSAAIGALDFLLPGAGSAMRVTAQIDGTRRAVQGMTAYRDVCDLAPDEKVVLLSTDFDPPVKPQTSFLERASKFLSR